jgi:hypothetical protein
MGDRDLAKELDDLKAELSLIQRIVTEAEEKSNAAFVQTAATAAHLASLIQRVGNLRVDVVAKIQG